MLNFALIKLFVGQFLYIIFTAASLGTDKGCVSLVLIWTCFYLLG